MGIAYAMVPLQCFFDESIWSMLHAASDCIDVTTCIYVANSTTFAKVKHLPAIVTIIWYSVCHHKNCT